MFRGWQDILRTFFNGFKRTRFWQHKLVMVLLAAAMFILIIFYTGFRAAIVAILSSTMPLIDDVARGGVVIENGILRDEFADGRLLEIKSKFSRSDGSNKDIIYLNDMRGRLLRPNPTATNLTSNATNLANTTSNSTDKAGDDLPAMTPSTMLANSELMNFTTALGILTTSQSSLLLDKDVDINLSNGLHITTSKVTVNFKAGEMHGEESIVGTGPRENFSGEGIDVRDHGNKIKLLGNSQMIISGNQNNTTR